MNLPVSNKKGLLYLNKILGWQFFFPVLKGIYKGKFTIQRWFSKNYASYEVTNEYIQLIRPKLNQFKIKVFMGTWCGDSRREIPRFYMILEAVNFPMDRLSVDAVD